MTTLPTPVLDTWYARLEAASATLISGAAPPKVRLRAVVRSKDAEPSTQSNERAVYGAVPCPTAEIEITRGSSTATLLGDGAVAAVDEVETRTRTLPWSFDRAVANVVLVLAGGSEVTVAETTDLDEAAARAALEPLREALSTYVGKTPRESDGPSVSELAAEPPDARRYSLRFEGNHLVLRDHVSRGPKERVARYRALALILVVLGLVGIVALIDRISNHAPVGAIIGVATVPTVLFIGAFAMSEVARHAAKYRATSAPLAWFADDRVVVEPWVSRDGAIDTTPEGRFGAAIACREIQKVAVHERAGLFAVTLEGLHGPIETLVTDSKEVARLIALKVEAAIEHVTSPKKRVTALMRAASAREAAE